MRPRFILHPFFFKNMPRPENRPSTALRPSPCNETTSAPPQERPYFRRADNVLCTASVARNVPPWLEGKGKGWITAEYSMLPGSTSLENPAKRGAKGSRMQRLRDSVTIGRSCGGRSGLEALGEQSITVDCDVLQADGGTRTLSITGGLIALVDAIVSSGSRCRIAIAIPSAIAWLPSVWESSTASRWPTWNMWRMSLPTWT